MRGTNPIKVGQRFGKLTVVRYESKSRWLCECSCGNSILVRSDNLQTGNSTSCRCVRVAKNKVKTHGLFRSRTYRSWGQMKARCQNPNATGYAKWGGRGITVCERWQAFENFLADMGERPAGHTLERIDNDGNYEPGNCRWATPKEQANNTRLTNKE